MDYSYGCAQLSIVSNCSGRSIINMEFFKKRNAIKLNPDAYIPDSHITARGFFRNSEKFLDNKRINIRCNSSEYMLPHSLLFKLKPDISSEQFISKIGNSCIIICLNGSPIWDLFLSFCVNFNPIIHENTEIAIKLPFDILCQRMPIMGSQYTDVDINLKMNDEFKEIIDSVTLHTDNCNLSYGAFKSKMTNTEKNTYEDLYGYKSSGLSRAFKQQMRILSIQQLQTINITQLSQEKIIILKADYILHTKGFFVEGYIDQLESFEVILDKIKISYNKIDLELYCKKITSNLIYIPITEKINYTELTKESFFGTPDLGRMDNIEIIITFSILQKRVLVSALSLNQLRIGEGFMSCIYSK
jgi:hypothetical protein